MNLETLPAYSSSLLLQGPIGPFFQHLAGFLRQRGGEVHKVNFNLGDDLFFPKDALRYTGTMEDLPEYLSNVLNVTDAQAIFLFGDCRPIHRIAMILAATRGIDVWVFEEGYIRPGYVTMELGGTNNHSRMPRRLDHYTGSDYEEAAKAVVPHLAQHGYAKMVWNGFLYFAAGALGNWRYPHYEHHKPLQLSEGLYWIRSLARKCLYKPFDALTERDLLHRHARRYFLVPLQVFNDASILHHSRYLRIEDFIEDVIASFACHAPRRTILVFKHHPMDRGYVDYGQHIAEVARRCGVDSARIRYVHDGHVPSLIRASRGVVLINSTMGIQALYHGARVMVMGSALYDMPELTYKGPLDGFWTSRFRPRRESAKRFRDALIAKTQVGGNFYDRAWCRKVCELEPVGFRAAAQALARKINSQNEVRRYRESESSYSQ